MTRNSIFIFLISLLVTCPTSLSAQLWARTQKMGSSDGQNGDQLGFSVALSDSFMIAGASWEDHDAEGDNFLSTAGSAYIYKMTPAGDWEEVEKLVSPFRQKSAYFGSSVAIEGDLALVGSIYGRGGTEPSSGVVYVYRQENDTSWVLEGQLKPSDGRSGDKFGEFLAIHEGYVIAGAPGHDWGENGVDSLSNAGAAYLFKREANQSWQELAKFVGTNRKGRDRFGSSVDISSSGLIIGATSQDSDVFSIDVGAAYIASVQNLSDFDMLNSTDLEIIFASDEGSFSAFGSSVGIEGDWAVVGCNNEIDPPAGSTERASGAAYFYRRENDVWVEKQKVYPSHYENSGAFGSVIALEGSAAVIGSPFGFSDESNANLLYAAGAAHIFELQADNRWIETGKIVGSQRKEDDQFARSVALNENRIAVGAAFADSLGTIENLNGGAIYVYERAWPLSIKDLPQIEQVSLVQGVGSQQKLHLLNQGIQGESFTLNIFSSNGQRIYQEVIRLAADWQKDFSHLAKGLYVVQLSKDGSLPKSWKWMK